MIFGKPLVLIGLFIFTWNAQVPREQSSAEEAIKLAQDEVLAHPNSADAYNRLGQAYLSHWYSVADKAAEAFEQAIRLKPDYAEAYYGLALAFDRVHRHQMQENHPKKEIKALEKAIKLNPTYAEAYVQLARTYMVNATRPNLNLEKTYKPAVKILNKAIHIKPDLAEAYDELGQAYSVLKEKEKADEAYKKAEKLKYKKKG